MAILKDLSVDQGATYINHLNIQIDGQPLDFIADGWDGRMSVKKSYASSASIIDLTTDNGKLLIHDDSVVGRLTINLDENDTKNINIKEESIDYVYDLEIFNGSGVVYRVWQGTFTINKNVTTIN